MAIQMRRGNYANFDPQKMKPGEFAVVQNNDPKSSDGKAVYICTQSGTVKRLISDLEVFDEVQNAADVIAQIIYEAVSEDVQRAEDAADLVSTSVEQIITNTNDISDIKTHLSMLIFTEDVKEALLACFEKVAWIDGSGEELYTALQNALEAKYVLSISAVFTQGSAVINPSTSLDTLKNYLSVTANYSDGTTETITTYTLSGTLTLGTSTILVSYLGRTALFTCTVSAATLASITCSFTQSGAVYSTDSLDSLKSGLVVTAVYSDSTTQNVPSADCTLSGTLSVGTSTITVTYQGKTATFNVTVSPPVELSSITAVFTQGQNVIYDDDTLDDLKQYLVVTANYSDSSTRTVSDYTLSGTLEVGTSTITVTYQGKTDDFDVTVVSGVQVAAISDSWDVILSGVNKYHIGNYKSLDLGSQGTVEMQIVAKGKDAKSDNSGNAKYTWISRGLLNTERRMNPAKVANTSGTGALGGWEASEMRAFLKSTVLPLIPPGIRSAIVPVNKYTRIYQASDETAVNNVVTSEDVWIPSTREIFINTNYESEGPTYDPLYADDGESNIKYLNGSANRYWARTAQSETHFRGVNLTAGSAGWTATETRGIALGFCTDSVTLPATRIEAVFDPGSNVIYTNDSLDSLKQYLTVTYFNNGTATVLASSAYTLSGTLTAGTCAITATYGNLITTFNVTVVSASSPTAISATYTQTGLEKSTDSLDSLKTNLVVTATYSDSSTSIISSANYSLSGSLSSGENTITVTYGNLTTTFKVVVDYIMFFDFTDSLADKARTFTAVLDSGTSYSDPQRDSTGLKFTAQTQSAYFGSVSDIVGKTIEYDIASMDFKGNLSYHVRLLMLTGGQTSGVGTTPFIWRHGYGYSAYGFANGTAGNTSKSWASDVWTGMSGDTKATIDQVSGKTVKLVISDSHTVSLYLDGTLIGTKTDLYWNDKGTSGVNCNHLKFCSLEKNAGAGDQCYDLVLTGLRVYSN